MYIIEIYVHPTHRKSPILYGNRKFMEISKKSLRNDNKFLFCFFVFFYAPSCKDEHVDNNIKMERKKKTNLNTLKTSLKKKLNLQNKYNKKK